MRSVLSPNSNVRVQADADIAEVVMGMPHTAFRHRHLGAEVGRIVAELAQMFRKRRGHRGQHRDGHRRAGQLIAAQDHRAHGPRTCRPVVAVQRGT